VACYGYSVAAYRNHTLRKTVLRNVLHERLFTFRAATRLCWDDSKEPTNGRSDAFTAEVAIETRTD
jgi:hypothetical protein